MVSGIFQNQGSLPRTQEARVEKKYTIHILAISAIDHETFDLPPEQNAVILCTSHDNPYVRAYLPENVLSLDFSDVTDKKHPGAFRSDHARLIIQFVRSLSEQVTDLYVCCARGESRSTAVAAALLRMSGRSDMPVWRNPYYVPNVLVYRTLCRAYGLFETSLSLRIRARINRRAFRQVKKGIPPQYEKWQLLL